MNGAGAAVIAAVAAQYGIGPIAQVARPSSGSMNDTFLLDVGADRFVLRRHRRPDLADIEFEHQVMAHARRRGIPVPDVLMTPSGDNAVRQDGHWHSMFAYAQGRQVDSAELDPARAAAMGGMLAHIHAALADFPGTRAPNLTPTPAAVTLRRIRRIEAAINHRPQQTPADLAALESLAGQADAVRLGPVDSRHHGLPAQMVHGDYQHSNLFFDVHGVCAVIDWDKAEIRPPAQEVVRALHLSLGLEPRLCSSFLEAYRTHRALPGAVLESAAADYGRQNLHDVWAYESVYLHGDERARGFLAAPPYLSFAERWAVLSDKPG